ncbi:MAG: methylmalonyl Co-A mutase-associated GTPase MeaB [Acidimicrobiia bacterium]|nr:methylmalonyl Co-A mutase-associated GTPase MeaB [Acidimicrobiia bacterium]
MAEFTDVAALVEGVRAGDRTMLGRAITLVESTRPDHREAAAELLTELADPAISSHRVGITGVPGVGKSTFIEALGVRLTGAGHRVAVLAVDPSSSRTGGSILGDKTRMPDLSVDAAAFIRPSPSSGTLGGVARATREAMVVLEAAGHDVVLVETVGVGQSETLVHGMVDFFLVLMLAGAGDELQGIKKGVLELADMVAVNKADGDNEVRARASARDYSAALRLLHPESPNWSPPVLTCSALHDVGLDVVWDRVEQHRAVMTASGELAERRRRQQLEWMWSMVDDRLRRRFRTAPGVAAELAQIESAVLDGELLPSLAADRLLAVVDL